MAELSVIICTHNPRLDYLRRIIEALRGQTLPKQQWELLVIDNASKEPLIKSLDLTWHPYARHVREEKLGLTTARLRGICEACSDILVFFDDDNVPRKDYLEMVVRIAKEHNKLGCYGAGVLIPEFEQVPAPEYQPYTGYLAIRSVARSIWGNSISGIPMPWGAGLVIRRAVAECYKCAADASSLRSELDRKGDSLMSGGDDEFSYAAYSLNLGFGIFPELEIRHLIGKRRVTEEYFKNVLFGNGRSSAILAYLHQMPLGNPFIVPRLLSVLIYFLQGHPARAFGSLAEWMGFQRSSRVDKIFLQAQSDGWISGLQHISSCQTDSNHRPVDSPQGENRG
jgi:glycosyltransferase involved in cell wall biosynthesis